MNRQNVISLLFLATILLVSLSISTQKSGSSENPTMTKQDDDTAAVKKLAKDYTAAWGSGDPELLLSCYADDAVVIMSHEEPIVGKEALRELYQHVFGAGKTEEEGSKKTEEDGGEKAEEEGGMAAMAEALGLNPEDYIFTTEGDKGKTEVSGDLGYLWSTYATVATPKPGVDAKPIRDSGVSLLIVKRQQDGAWKVALMMATRGENPLAASQENGTGE